LRSGYKKHIALGSDAKEVEMDEHTDEALLARAAADAEAFAALYRRYVDAIEGFCARRSGEPEDVADLVAAVFAAVLERAGRYDARRLGAYPWLFGTSLRAVAGFPRRWLRPAGRLHIRGRELLNEADVTCLRARIDAERDGRWLWQEVQDLPRAQRAMLELVEVDGLEPAEAAAALGLSPAVASVRLGGARRRARSLLSRHGVAPFWAPGAATARPAGLAHICRPVGFEERLLSELRTAQGVST
jgi:RNA polymerase sigma factor (sigma-70 family)